MFFDLETGGVEPHQPDIQLAAVAVGSDWSELGSFSERIQFREEDADPEALKMNHYDAEVWQKTARPAAVVVGQFSRFLNDYKVLELVSKRTKKPYSVARLAGFNAATFDGPRLRRLYGDQFLPAHPIPLCIMQLCLWFFHERSDKPENYKLGTLCQYFGIEQREAHEALADVRSTVELCRRIQELRAVPDAAVSA